MATRSFWCASYAHGKETHWWKIGLLSEVSSDGRTHQMYELRTGKRCRHWWKIGLPSEDSSHVTEELIRCTNYAQENDADTGGKSVCPRKTRLMEDLLRCASYASHGNETDNGGKSVCSRKTRLMEDFFRGTSCAVHRKTRQTLLTDQSALADGRTHQMSELCTGKRGHQ